MAERRVDFVVRAAGDHGVQAAHLGGREDDVGRDADHQRPGRDAAERLLQSAPPAARVVRVEGVEDRVIGVGVVTAAEFFALVLLVGARPCRC